MGNSVSGGPELIRVSDSVRFFGEVRWEKPGRQTWDLLECEGGGWYHTGPSKGY